jgi:methylase of polypeptide subunit release factors
VDPELIDRLHADLAAADYRVDAVASLLGAAADGARQRGVFAPALRALGERDEGPLAALVRLFLLAQRVDGAELDAALPELGAAGAIGLGLVEADRDGRLRAALSLNPVAVTDARSDRPLHWWIISDLDDQLRRRPARPDHVMGVGGATRSLISQAPPADAARCLDLGTGCGIVAMHLALRGEVVATDISERALTMARANARLGGVEHRIDFRLGDLFAPVAGERFDLVLSNPPFVITPRGDGDAPVYEYRDGGMAGDGLAERVVSEAPAHLAENGTLLCLANWESPWGSNGLERVREWIEAAAGSAGALDAWVIERDRVDPAQYAETWARDGGARPGTDEFERLMGSWLDDFAARRITAIGLGAIRARRCASAGAAERALVEVDRAAGAYAAQDLGGGLAAAFDAGVRAARMSDAEVLATRWLRAEAVVEEREHTPGEEAPRAIRLTTDRPIARRVAADPLIAAAVGVCDGELSLGRIADALATLLEVDADAAAEALVAGFRELAWLGMLAPLE